MLSQDDLKSAEKFSTKTHLFLSLNNLAPTPVNYSVGYIYVSKNHQQLAQAIDQKSHDNKPIDTAFIEEMFNQYLSNSNSIQHDILEPFFASLTDTLQRIDHQVTNDQQLSNNLEKVSSALVKLDNHHSVQDIVSYLISSIKSSHQQHQSLSKKLEKTSSEVNQLKNKLQESQQEAFLDSLTGLLNRRGGEEKLKELALEDQHSSLMIDIDLFKNFNDKFGHFIGDKVLQRVAKVIAESVDKEDLTMRFGGEEFLVVLVNKAKSEASLIAEKIRHAVNSLKPKQRQTKITLPPISVSIGIAEVEEDQHWDDLFKRADDALYQAKNTGRNRCVVA